MRLVVRHVYDFREDRVRVGADLVRPEAWDAARATSGSFGLARTRGEWEQGADRDDLRARAADVVAVASELGAASLCSHGVGTAGLELNIHRLQPQLRLVCTDFAPETVVRLQRLFAEAEVVQRDLRDPTPPAADLHLMHRLDAELPHDAWRQVFGELRAPILFVPNLVLDLSGALRELARRARLRGHGTRAGWFRNEAALRALWRDTHHDTAASIGGAPAFLLEPR